MEISSNIQWTIDQYAKLQSIDNRIHSRTKKTPSIHIKRNTRINYATCSKPELERILSKNNTLLQNKYLYFNLFQLQFDRKFVDSLPDGGEKLQQQQSLIQQELKKFEEKQDNDSMDDVTSKMQHLGLGINQDKADKIKAKSLTIFCAEYCIGTNNFYANGRIYSITARN